VVSLSPAKLTRPQSAALVTGLAGEKPLPVGLLEQIIAKSDGIPLFVEELTKSILESGALRDAHMGGVDACTKCYVLISFNPSRSSSTAAKGVNRSVEAAMSGRGVAKNIGAFVLFLVLYIIFSAILHAIFVVGFDNFILRKLLGFLFGSAPYAVYETAADLFASVLAGFLGVATGRMALDAMIKNYSARGVGVGLILWLAANYTLHFIQFPEYTDYSIYIGLVQSAVACVTAWLVFQLPPFATPSPPSNAGAAVS
jgi:hypothetical protein